MNPCDPTEHFYICSDCGQPILGSGECRECSVETVQVPDPISFGVFVVLGLSALFMILMVSKILGYLGWTRYLVEFGHFLKGGK